MTFVPLYTNLLNLNDWTSKAHFNDTAEFGQNIQYENYSYLPSIPTHAVIK